MNLRRGLFLIAAALLLPHAARATSSDAAAAETLFREAKTLMAAKDFAAACPKLAESMRLDPGTGTLLTLALCHESAGQTASAWAEFTEAIAPSRADGRADRIQIATAHAAALEPSLVRIRLSIGEEVWKRPDVVILRDGASVTPAVFNSAIPVDPGEHVIRVLDHGQLVFSRTVRARTPGETYTVEISATALLPRAPALSPRESVAESDGAASRHPLRPLGFTLGGVGLAGIALGSIFGVQAMDQARVARGMCPGNVCPTPDGISQNNRARTSATLSDVAFIGGGALLVTGVVLLLLPAAKDTPLEQAHFSVGPDGVSVGYSGAF